MSGQCLYSPQVMINEHTQYPRYLLPSSPDPDTHQTLSRIDGCVVKSRNMQRDFYVIQLAKIFSYINKATFLRYKYNEIVDVLFKPALVYSIAILQYLSEEELGMILVSLPLQCMCCLFPLPISSGLGPGTDAPRYTALVWLMSLATQIF